MIIELCSLTRWLAEFDWHSSISSQHWRLIWCSLVSMYWLVHIQYTSPQSEKGLSIPLVMEDYVTLLIRCLINCNIHSARLQKYDCWKEILLLAMKDHATLLSVLSTLMPNVKHRLPFPVEWCQIWPFWEYYMSSRIYINKGHVVLSFSPFLL